MEAAADALVGEDGHLSDDSKAGQSMKRHRSRVPMAASNDDAGGSSLAHATTFATEPSSSSTRTGGGDAELMPDQSGAEALDSVEAPFEGWGQHRSWARRSRKSSPTSSSVPVHSRWPGPVLWGWPAVDLHRATF